MLRQKLLLSTCCLITACWLALSEIHLTVPTGQSEPSSLLKSLEEVHFDTSRSFLVRDLSLRRDSFTLNFERGRMIFLKPVDGVVTGLLFRGEGTIIFRPPNKIERQQLNLFAGSPLMNEHFAEAVLRFTDNTYEELMQQFGEVPESQLVEEDPLLEQFESQLRSSILTNYRIMADLKNGRQTPMLSARILGRTLGIFDVGFDRRKKEDIYLGQYRGIGETAYYDSWCSFSSRQRVAEGSEEDPLGGLIDIKSFNLVTRIDKNDHLTGTADVEFVCEKEREWVLTFDLSRSLKVSRVLDDHQKELQFYQNSEMTTDQAISRLGHDLVLVLLREPTHQGQRMSLQFQYTGDVISRVGSGVFYVGSRGSWYPNAGPTDRARYRLEFRYPKSFTIVATGDLVKEWEEGELKFSVWDSSGEIPMAGFNYGDYQKTTTMTGKTPVEVYANRNIENIHLEILSRIEVLRQLRAQRQANIRQPLPEFVPEPPPISQLDFDTTQFAKIIAKQVAGTLDLFQKMLGDFPYGKLSVSPIPGRFSQGWPSLLYVSSLSFLGPSQRSRLGLDHDQETYFYDCLHAHEVAHQWWGNKVGWKSYHDLWIFEGFSTYLGYLSLMSKYPDGRQFQEVMRLSKEKLQSQGQNHLRLENIGSVWLGFRLRSSKFPDGYTTVIYEKGAWIFHMLRYLFQDPITGSEVRFQNFLKELMESFAGRLLSTEDLRRFAEKHMPKAIDLEGNRTLDWFFEEWVYDSGIPTYRISYSIAPLKEGRCLVKGKILQEDVPESFAMPVEVFAHFPAEKVVKLGRVDVSGKETIFRFTLATKPQRISLDRNNQILCNNKTL